MTRSLPVEHSTLSDADRFATRYELHELLGKGGMAVVHRATDRVLGRPVALKQLTVDANAPERAHMAALFEREFHTLAQLSHPHVIGVFDYGLCANGAPYYTMELLDGGDLRERAQLPWSEACRLMFDVGSALALLHSRRLLHRDVTPRNIRCTQSGVAKLIDFGALSPMSAGGSDVVGTPAFTAPETLQRLALDARTDLYSFGVTLYFALTGRLPYNVRAFAELMGAWGRRPVAPSAFVSDIPAALDDLVLSLVSPEPALRPASAFEVMQRLAACAGLQSAESEAVSRAYLSTPTLVGRAAELERVHEAMRTSRMRKSAGVIIEGASGSGRSRLLDACALDALTRGFSVSRATATGAREPFAVAQRLVSHILDTQPRAAEVAAVPELFTSAVAANDPASRPSLRSIAELDAGRAQKLLRRFILGVSRAQPLLIAVDDVHKIDEPSAAVLAELIDSAGRGGILVLLTADSLAPENVAWHALARRCELLNIAALTREQTGELLDSLFGAVANLDLLRDEIYAVARGNPRETLTLAQHLVDRGLIRYTVGSWTLPAKLSAADLPRSASAALHARIERFSPSARFLAEAQSLAFQEELTDADYRALLPEVSSSDVERALLELLEAGALLRDGAVYRLANRVWTAAFLAGLDEQAQQRRHQALADLYEGKSRSALVHHAFAGALYERGLEALLQRDGGREISEAEAIQRAQTDAGKMMWCFPLAIATAQRLGHSPSVVHELRRWQYLGSVTSPLPPDRQSARIWLEQVMHDAGLDLYRSDTQSATAQERLMSSLQRAHERYLATPEQERVYPVDQAIRRLGEYVLLAVVEGARSLDSELLRSLPDYLEPYAPLSPLLDAMWFNMLGARDLHCNSSWQRARELWIQTLEKIAALSGSTEGFVVPMRNAVVFALGSAEAQLGLVSAAQQAERLDSDVFQRISALSLRKIVRLEQGDAEGAERFRRQAEVLSLQQRLPQMFNSSLAFEVFMYSKCNHLAGLTQTIEQLKPFAARFPGWKPLLAHGEASFELVRGDIEAARAKFQEGLQHGRGPAEPPIYFWTWMSLHAGLCECLLSLGRPEEARSIASTALQECEARGTGVSAFEIIHVLALAEAKLGDARAAQRLEELIARQNELGSSGLRMGLSYETRARVAILNGDAQAFERYSELTAREYRHGVRTSLAARYERLMNEAARAGMQAKLTLAEFQALASTTDSVLGSTDLLSIVTRTMAGQHSIAERAQIALQMICAAHAAQVGYLYLITPAGPVLRASQGRATPADGLTQLVSDYVSEQQQQADELDDMVTGAAHDDEPTSQPPAPAGSHELLALRCVVDAASVLVGLAVIERTGHAEPQAQLLQLLATSLHESGEASAAAPRR